MALTPALCLGVLVATFFLGGCAPPAARGAAPAPDSTAAVRHVSPIWALSPAEGRYPQVDDRLADRLGELGLIPFPVSAVFSQWDSLVVVLTKSGEVERVWKLPETLSPLGLCNPSGIAMGNDRFIFLGGLSFRDDGGSLWSFDAATGEISRMEGTSRVLPEPSARAALFRGDLRSLDSRGVIIDSAGVRYGLRTPIFDARFLGDESWTVAMRPDSALSKLDYAAGAAYRDVYSLRGALLKSVDTELRGLFVGSSINGDGWTAVRTLEMLPPSRGDSLYGRPFSLGRHMLAVVAPDGGVRSAVLDELDDAARPRDIAFGRVLLAGWDEVRVVDLGTLGERAAFALPAPTTPGHRPGIVRSAVLLSDALVAVVAVEPDSLPRSPYQEHRTVRVISTSGDVLAELEDWPGARLPPERVLGSQVQLLREPGGTLLVNVAGIGAAIYPPVAR